MQQLRLLLFKDLEQFLFLLLAGAGCSSCRYSSSSCCLATTSTASTTAAATASTTLAFTSGIYFIEVNKLDHSHLRTIAAAEAGLDHPYITAWPAGDFRANRIEKLLHRQLVLQVAKHHTTGVGRIVFRLGHQWFDVSTQGLRLGEGRVDALVFDQRTGQVAHQRFAVSRFTAEVV